MTNSGNYHRLTRLGTHSGGADIWLTTEELRGADKMPAIWGYRRPGRATLAPVELYVPGSTQNNRIRIALDGGGHIFEWDLTVGGTTRQIMNHQGGYGRSLQHALFFSEDVQSLPIAAITKGTTTLIRVSFPHGFDIGTKVALNISGVNVLATDINGSYGQHETGSDNPATAYDQGDYYMQTFSLPVDTSAVVGTYTGGTCKVRILHNPTQAGSAYCGQPQGQPVGGRHIVDPATQQGSPLLSYEMKLLASNQGYIKTVSMPLEWNPDDPENGHDHGGGRLNPVIWDAITLTNEYWINYQGNEGIHKWTTTVTCHRPIWVGIDQLMSCQFSSHMRWGLGVGAGNPIHRAHKLTSLSPYAVSLFGTAGKLTSTNWPVGGLGGKYSDTTLGFGPHTTLGLTYRDLSTETTDGIYPDLGANIFGGCASMSSPSDEIAFGFWNVSTINPSFIAYSWWPYLGDSGYGAYSSAGNQLSSWHGLRSTNGYVTAGDHPMTTWVLTGAFSSFGDASTGLIKTMLDNSWW